MRRAGIAALVVAGALAAPAGASAEEWRGENSTGDPVVMQVEGSTVVSFEITVPAYCIRTSRRGPIRRKRTVRYTNAIGAAVEPDGWFFYKGRTGSYRAEIGGRISQYGDATGRFKLRPFKSGRWRCVSPRVSWGATRPFTP